MTSSSDFGRKVWSWVSLLAAILVSLATLRIGGRMLAIDAGPSTSPSGDGRMSECAIAEHREPIPPPLPPGTWRAIVAVLVGLSGMGAFLALAPQAAAGGWLIAFAFWSSISIGSLLVIMIHRLTGGRWGRRFNLVFIPTAASVPAVAVLLAPVLIALPVFYPWAAGTEEIKPDVLAYYLSSPLFISRSVIVFIVWTILAYSLPRLTGSSGVLLACLGLAAYGALIGVVAVDWILSTEPPFISTSFGATLAFLQFASAIAWALIISPRVGSDRAYSDLGGLFLAALLGITYINFMAVLIIWYGDVPSHVSWLVQRDRWPWTLVAVVAFVLGSIVPVFALLLGRVRSDPQLLRIFSLIALAGFTLFYGYCIAPRFGLLSLAAAPLAMLAMGGIVKASMATSWSRTAYRRWSLGDEA